MGTQPRPQKGARPQFSAHVYCGQTAVCIKIPLGVEVDLSLGDIVLDADPAPPSLKGTAPQFLAIVSCGQTPGWTKMPLGTEGNLGPGHIVLDGYPAPSPRERGTAAPPLFSAYVYCGHGRPSQLLLNSCSFYPQFHSAFVSQRTARES